ncbi:DUF1036 domain-containing protein [Caballeronia sp. LjRoot29]|uniref:DUF1036 domain-containing protein n=1 Tax=Caballeronia sp. LjRoot29 TaxID=3342315 RepID=UPI003ECC8B3F
MKKLLITLAYLLAVTAFPSIARAGLFLCNDTGESIDVAIGWNEDGVWLSKGWYSVPPRQCSAPILGPLKSKYYYYYANSVGGTLKWDGGQNPDRGYFCTNDDARFFFRNLDTRCNGHNFIRRTADASNRMVITLTERQTDPKAAALNCQRQIQNGRDAFAKCWMRNMASDKQERILKCLDRSHSNASLAICANKDNLDPDVYYVATCASRYSENRKGDDFLICLSSMSAFPASDDQAKLFQCAVNHNGDYGAMGACALAGNLTEEQKRVYSCVADNINDYRKAGLCAAGNQLTPEERKIAACVMDNKGSYTQMAVCSVGSSLTPEQQVFVNCAMTTGGQPYALAGCVGTQLTMNELEKCMTAGIGGEGCFGENNTAVKTVTNAWKDVTQGPGPSNDIVGQDGVLIKKASDIANDLQNGPGPSNDIVGADGFVQKKLGDIGNDIQNGPGPSNDLVGKDGFVGHLLGW